jgi:tripartite-type tricarboxylate transporter receptor subunit TctC
MARTRWAAAPDIPTIDEAGVPGLYASYWHGLWVPKGTPKEPITRLNSAVQAALADTTVRQRLADQGYDVLPREHREMGQGDPGRQHQAAGIKSRSKIGKTFHNVSLN